jgi:hypothetical protein
MVVSLDEYCSYGISIVSSLTGLISVTLSVGVPYLCILCCTGRLWFVVLHIPDVFAASDCKVRLVCPTYALLQVLYVIL